MTRVVDTGHVCLLLLCGGVTNVPIHQQLPLSAAVPGNTGKGAFRGLSYGLRRPVRDSIRGSVRDSRDQLGTQLGAQLGTHETS